MYYLIYISTAVKLMSQPELTEILADSRKKNTSNNITGMLLYSQGTFIQALEGDEQTVNKTYKAIEKDKRHKNLVILISDTSDQRIFPDWSMAFVALDPGKTVDLEGYINPLKRGLINADDTTAAITILKTFAENNNLTYND